MSYQIFKLVFLPNFQDCHYLQLGETKWSKDESLTEPRSFAASVVVPTQGHWILGGLPRDSMLTTSIRKSVGASWMPGPLLPQRMDKKNSCVLDR